MKKLNSKKLSIKGAQIDKARLCSYLEKLASEQIVKSFSDDNTYPINSLKEDFNAITNTYNLLNDHAKLKITIDPAGEWLLDNYYVIEETAKSIIKELTLKKYRELIGVGNGRYKGFARIYVLAAEIMAYTDGKIEEENIELFLRAYQSQKMLTIEEIWILPIFLQIAAIQNIKEICDRLCNSQIQKYKAESIIERLVERKEKDKQKFNGEIKFIKTNNENMNFAFVEYLSYKLKSYGKKGTAYLQVLEEQVNKMGTTIGDVIKHVHFSLATNKVSMGNFITSLREVSHIDFNEISKEIGGIEEILKQDPARVYSKMDYKTKNDYQNEIQKIARKVNISEVYIAKMLIEICKNQTDERRKHIGYFLLEDINFLYQKLDVNKKVMSKTKKMRIYTTINTILPMYLCFLCFTFFLVKGSNVLESLLSVILLYLPFTEIIIQINSYILGKVVTPKRLPKLDFSMGVPQEAATFVVIPTILKDRKKVKELMHKLEVYYLANKSKNVFFALLGDVTSSNTEYEEFDEQIIKEGQNQIKRLNEKYPPEEYEISKFHFLYRKRSWNPKEACFLGWERKRGLLNQFNDFLIKPDNNEFRYNSIEGEMQNLPQIKYVITLDADTNLTLSSGLELIGAMEHILNKPIVDKGRVIAGHALIQPRIGIDLDASNHSTFSKIYGIPGGTDLYSNATSDVYQDNFDEGIFTGKGIYNLKVFSDVISNQIPENLVLSHDLLEGSYLRCGLASDIILLDGFPSKYNSYMTRLKRWIRGDWQIVQWIKPKIKIRNEMNITNPLNALSKYKIFDNMRRSLLPVGIFTLLIVGMINSKPPDGELIIISLISAMIGTFLKGLDQIIFRKEIDNGFVAANKSFLWKTGSLTGILYQNLLELCFLPYRTYISASAIIKTLYRIFVSKKNLLEWLTAEEAEKQAITSNRAYYMQMIINVISGVGLLFFSVQGNILQKILGVVISIMWIIGPAVACQISNPISEVKPKDRINSEEKEHLLKIARKTWSYFSEFVNDENNFLPPDNYESDRLKKVAPRTSPTNIGLGMLSIVSAIDLEFITYEKGLELLIKMSNTIDMLCKWNGHLYNWYNTETLEPLNPKYISSVDSGNFIGYLYVLKQFLQENKENRKEDTEILIKKLDCWINNADFSKLYDEKKKLFSIGFNIEENKLTDSYYDLLASEARQTSLIAIAKKDVPQKHWSALSRTLTVFNKYKGLVSWSGTAFEYLMPNMIIKNYQGSLLEESCKFMVLCQREYCEKLGIPWGISEAAFSLKDLYGNYQYKAFGIPWLGLKRGLSEERVVSSYGSILAIYDYPKEVVNNIKALEDSNMLRKIWTL